MHRNPPPRASRAAPAHETPTRLRNRLTLSPKVVILMTSRTPLVLAASAGACALALGVSAPVMAAPAAGGDDPAMVSVFHGVPGLTVDVYANGNELLSDFEPGTVTDPQSLDAGTYDIQVFEAGQSPDGTPAIE